MVLIVLQPVMFPKSLRGYVERAMARCNNDVEIAAFQAVMKEVSFVLDESIFYSYVSLIERVFVCLHLCGVSSICVYILCV